MPSYQTGKAVYVAFKLETTLGTAPGATGGTRLRINPSSGLRFRRARIENPEVRADGQSSIDRLGSRMVEGAYVCNASIGSLDTLLAAALRGNWSGLVLTPSVPPVSRSFTFEQGETDIDAAELFKGCRIVSMTVRLTPDGMATVEFGIVGLDMELLTGAAAPYFTSPTETTSDALVGTDATIALGGAGVVDLTALEFTVSLGGATQAVVGSTVSPDVFTNNMRISGTISALRKDLVRQTAYIAETTMALALTLRELAPSTRTLGFELPLIKFVDFEKALGQDNAVIATLPFAAGKPAGANMITVTSTL